MNEDSWFVHVIGSIAAIICFICFLGIARIIGNKMIEQAVSLRINHKNMALAGVTGYLIGRTMRKR